MLARAIVIALALTGAAQAQDQSISLVAVGDSLTAGYGLGPGEAFPDVLEAELRRKGWNVSIQNAGVSGQTASSGADGIDWVVSEEADGVILALGANDMLRGIDPAITRAALDRALARMGERGIPVLLAGMMAPRNLGPEYVAAFDAIYPELAETHDAEFHPFLLDGVAGKPELNLPDGIHPTAEGVRVMVARILPAAEALLQRIDTNR